MRKPIKAKLRGGPDSNDINKLFTAVYDDTVEAFEYVDEILDNRLPNTTDSWTKAMASQDGGNAGALEAKQKEILKAYPRQALECYKLEFEINLWIILACLGSLFAYFSTHFELKSS